MNQEAPTSPGIVQAFSAYFLGRLILSAKTDGVGAEIAQIVLDQYPLQS